MKMIFCQKCINGKCNFKSLSLSVPRLMYRQAKIMTCDDQLIILRRTITYTCVLCFGLQKTLSFISGRSSASIYLKAFK